LSGFSLEGKLHDLFFPSSLENLQIYREKQRHSHFPTIKKNLHNTKPPHFSQRSSRVDISWSTSRTHLENWMIERERERECENFTSINPNIILTKKEKPMWVYHREKKSSLVSLSLPLIIYLKFCYNCFLNVFYLEIY